MNVTLKRTFTGDGVTLGELSIDGMFFSHTLEPDDQGVAHPAIPLGIYRIIINYSARFRKQLPLVLNVPGRSGIRIHPGNDAADTEGCILLGQSEMAGEQRIRNSRETCERFMARIQPVLSAGRPVMLSVELADSSHGARSA